MTRLALIGTSTLIGDEVKDELGRRRDLWSDLRLLTFEPDTLGNVADLDGEATFVRAYSAEAMEDVELLIVVGEQAIRRALEEELPGDVRVLIVSPESWIESGAALVDGINPVGGRLQEKVADGRVLVSPHPAVIGLSLLLRPLLSLGLERADALLLKPSSMSGQEGLDELLEQSRRILNFQGQLPIDVFHHQLAYNILPAPESPADVLRDLSAILEGPMPVSLHIAQASVFHGCSLALHLLFEGEVGAPAVKSALSGAPFVSLVKGTHLGPIDSAGSGDIHVAKFASDPNGEPGRSGFWLWSVFDNLTRGGALNAVAIVEALFASRSD